MQGKHTLSKKSTTMHKCCTSFRFRFFQLYTSSEFWGIFNTGHKLAGSRSGIFWCSCAKQQKPNRPYLPNAFAGSKRLEPSGTWQKNTKKRSFISSRGAITCLQVIKTRAVSFNSERCWIREEGCTHWIHMRYSPSQLITAWSHAIDKAIWCDSI